MARQYSHLKFCQLPLKKKNAFKYFIAIFFNVLISGRSSHRPAFKRTVEQEVVVSLDEKETRGDADTRLNAIFQYMYRAFLLFCKITNKSTITINL